VGVIAAGRPLYGVDSGGSTTSVATSGGDRWDAPSVNPASVGLAASARSLSGVFDRIRRDVGSRDVGSRDVGSRDVGSRDVGRRGERPAVWLASASLDPAEPDGEVGRLARAARSAGVRGELVVSNDVTPLVLGVPAGVGHVVAVCGTGSGFAASDGRSPARRVGGCEYLASDEGSAFDLGLRGLRAAVRGRDGRSEQTILTGLLESHAGTPVPELGRRLARAPFPKSAVAALAPIVVRAWRQGDTVAARLVGEAIGELALGVRAARDAAALAPGWRVSAAGGVVRGSPEFFGEFAAAAARLGADSVRLITDPATVILATLTRFAGADEVRLSDPRIGADVWRVDLDKPGPW
jgi:N-acetylglucosamine kinase-like BadF-type ATPase